MKFGSALVNQVIDVGTFKLSFVGDNAVTMDYSVDGRTGSLPLVRNGS